MKKLISQLKHSKKLADELLNIDKWRQKKNTEFQKQLTEIYTDPKKAIEKLRKIEEAVDFYADEVTKKQEQIVEQQRKLNIQRDRENIYRLRFSVETARGNTWHSLNQLEKANQAYKEALKFVSEEDLDSKGSAESSLGDICYQQGNFQEAVKHYEAAITAYRKSYADNTYYSNIEVWEEVGERSYQEKMASYCQNQAYQAKKSIITNLKSLAHTKLSQEKREQFFDIQNKAIKEAIETANEYNSYEALGLAQQMQLDLFELKLLWDISGETEDILLSKKRIFDNTENQREIKKALEKIEKNQEESLHIQKNKLTSEEIDIEIYLLIASNFIRLKVIDAAELSLNQAQKIIKNNDRLSHKYFDLNLAYAELYYLNSQKISQGIEYAEKAFRFAEREDNIDLMDLALSSLIPLRQLQMKIPHHYEYQFDLAMQEMGKMIELLKESDTKSGLAESLLRRASVYIEAELTEENLSKALADLEEAESFAKTAESLSYILLAQSHVLKKLGEIEKAYFVIQKIVKLSQEKLIPMEKLNPNSWGDFLKQTEGLYAQAAFLASKIERNKEAFNWAERGKAVALRQQLVQAGKDMGNEEWQIPQVSFDEELRTFLQEESAAILMFCVRSGQDEAEGGQTLAILIEPNIAVPQTFYVQLSENDSEFEENRLKCSAFKSKSRDSAEHLQKLSEQLFSPTLQESLERAMNIYQVLYIVPDSRLPSIPFAALIVKGEELIEKNCPIAVVPSVSILKWCCSRRFNASNRNCLAVGFGETSGTDEKIKFAEQIKYVIPEYGWDKETTWLLNEKATPKHFWLHAHSHSVIHFSCHGHENEIGIDTLSALKLELAEKTELTAKDIIQCNPKLNADLIFLDACVSGRFKYRPGNSVGGFWQAFLYAGATTLIATLTKVDAEEAKFIAEHFYQEWLKGNVTKAKALQKAQLKLRKKKPNSLGWAHHILVGDYS